MGHKVTIRDVSTSVPCLQISYNGRKEEILVTGVDSLPTNNLDLLRLLIEEIDDDPRHLEDAAVIFEDAAMSKASMVIRGIEYGPGQLRSIYDSILSLDLD